MKSNYRKIGDFIKLVDERNKDLKVTKLLGLSISKQFIPSVANTIGTNMKNYKIIRKNQFACSTMQVRRDKKMPVALLQDFDEAIISQAYPVFEVVDESILNPEYLMMWFSRSEFDRHACFLAVGGVRGSLEWEDFLEMPIPIPSIEKQNEIVAEYNTIVNRIKLNQTLNQKLEDTAQALYKHWFVDFNFPITKESCPELVSGSPELEGKPYKSSGGEMVYNEELDKEIPLGWDSGKLDKYVTLSQGQVINAKTRYLVVKNGLPLLKITDLFNDTATMFIDPEKVNKKNLATKEDLIYTRTGQVGYIFRNKEGVVYNNCFKVNPIEGYLSKEFIYWYLKDENTRRLMIDLASGSAQPDLTHSAFFSVSILCPVVKIQDDFSKISLTIVKNIDEKHQLNLKLETFKNIILSKMSKTETKTAVV
ncbi:restriction endonuclease subunit S [Winogradskyella sp. PC D3.3]